MNEIINMSNIKNIYYWTDINGDIFLPGDSALARRSEKDLPPIAAAVYNALNTDCGFSERVVTMKGSFPCQHGRGRKALPRPCPQAGRRPHRPPDRAV